MLSLFSWSINDAREAAHNALEIGDWAAVGKYRDQIQAFTDAAGRLEAARERGWARAAKTAGRGYSRVANKRNRSVRAA